MTPLDRKTLSDLKLAQARMYQESYASDRFWEETRNAYEVNKRLLAARKKLQAFARNCDENPLRFCDSVLGQHWFDAKEISSRQASVMLKIFADVRNFPSAPEDIAKLDGKELLGNLQTLAMRPPGRKRLGIYAAALALSQAKPPLNIHKICQKLNPTYATMTSAERRAERERIRSGIKRLKKASPQRQRSRNTPQ